MVSFRVSEEEYETLRETSLNRGARSVSDYARSVLIGLTIGSRQVADHRIEHLDQRMHELNREVQRLVHLIEKQAHG